VVGAVILAGISRSHELKKQKFDLVAQSTSEGQIGLRKP
jgi:hypothetical protein